MPRFRKQLVGGYSITVDYGYDIHNISVHPTEWRRICAGEAVSMPGHGFHCEGEKLKDIWNFNCAKMGSISVDAEDAATIFDGELSDFEVRISDPGGHAVTAPIYLNQSARLS